MQGAGRGEAAGATPALIGAQNLPDSSRSTQFGLWPVATEPRHRYGLQHVSRAEAVGPPLAVAATGVLPRARDTCVLGR